MKTLHLSITIFFLVTVFFPFNTTLAQSETESKIEFDQASYFTKKMTCNFYNTGKISTQDQEQKKATIIVTDPNANKFSTSIDRVTVYVWSDSDQKGIEITAYETEVNSGIFKGTVTISEGQSTQDTIHVSDGDTLLAKYTGTTPWSITVTNHGVITTAFIGTSCPPLERIPASSIRVLDNKGNEHNVITVDQQVLITSDIVNPTTTNQTFTYIVQIQDNNGSVASLAWLSGKMLPNQAFSPSVSWTPSNVGNYVVNVFVWESLDNPNALSPPIFADLTVLHDSATHKKSTIGNIENLHCKLGFELVIKPSNNSVACVTEKTAKRLTNLGWGVMPVIQNKTLPQSQDPFVADKDGKVDLSKINLPLTQYGHIDYEKIGYLVSENKFKTILEQQNVNYPDNNFLFLLGMELLSLPPFTDYCGYVMDNNKVEHWFSSSFHNDTLTNYTTYKQNPDPCKPGFDSCSCRLQTKIAENNLKELSYFTPSEEEAVGNSITKYLDKTGIVNVSNDFTVGKYNLQASDPSLIHYCGKFTYGEGLEYFDGYIKDSNVTFFELATEKPKLCAINSGAKLFLFDYIVNGTGK